MTQPAPAAAIPDAERRLLRHTVATLAYRAEKALRGPADRFATHRLAPSARTPLEIAAHLGDLAEWAVRLANGQYQWAPAPCRDWDHAVQRFFAGLAALDAALVAAPLSAADAQRLFQGPIADALTHVGQIAMIRGIAGDAVRPESYARAEIALGRVGADQSSSRREFDGDASRPKS